MTDKPLDAIILGAGAAGLFCAGEAGRLGHSILVLDHAKRIGEKIRISGGGRCNFTNIHARPENFISQNSKFCISALKRFTPQHFLDRVNDADIAWHEKTLGQLFCDYRAQDIIDMLMKGARGTGVTIQGETTIKKVSREGAFFRVETTGGTYLSTALIVATGGLSIPKIGATGLGYDLARQFGLDLLERRAGLVPLTFEGPILENAKTLAGVSVDAEIHCGRTMFREGLLFTHRGLSGPSILQISNYWRDGEAIAVNLLPSVNIATSLADARRENGRQTVEKVLTSYLPKRLVQTHAGTGDHRVGDSGAALGRGLAEVGNKSLDQLARHFQHWQVYPSGTEGYRTAEVTLGGVDTRGLNSRTMETNSVPGLYFIGEVVDVTGWLGGYNFQWAWASAHAAAMSL
ncbi:MAG: NAD(P)/FAD-dependent oxidoreductase [Pseudomonadota bacterium]